MVDLGNAEGGRSYSVVVDDQLDGRIRSAYRRAMQAVADDDTSLWAIIHRSKSDIHEALATSTIGPLALRDPASSAFFHGFDNLTSDIIKSHSSDASQHAWIKMFERDLRVLAQAMGVKRFANPEGKGGFVYNEPIETMTIAEIVEGMSASFGSRLLFPNPFPNELGLRVPGGLASQRVMPAIYQAWRLRQLAKTYGSRVVEIGAGLGRTAYYASTAAGITDYTIVDLPLTNAAQASFLGRTLGPERISLYGETHRPGSIRIMPVQWFRQSSPACDIALNVDSLTEMPTVDANFYAQWSMSKARVLLSINHEANEVPVRSLPALDGRCVGRFPVMIRPGYVEEIFSPPAINLIQRSWRTVLRAVK